MSSEAVYVISVAAKLAGMHPQTLREYERKGLVAPSRTAGNTRRYSDQDLERLREIQRLTQDEGMNLAGAAAVLELRERLDEAGRRLAELKSTLEETREEARATIAEVHRRYRSDLVVYRPPAKLVRQRRS